MKKYFCKVYKSNGNYITSWQDASFESFTKTINGGLGEVTIKLARKFDDFGENNDVKLNNEVQIWLSDKDTGSEGTKIYSGFISYYKPEIDGANEYVEIRCLGYVSKLATSILKNGVQIELKTDSSTGLTTGSTASAVRINTLVSSIVDRYVAESNNPKINYSSNSIDTTINELTYTFNGKTYKDAIEKCREASPANWWWYVGEDNILQFKPKPNIRTHQFIFGKDFKKVSVEKNMESVSNKILFSSGDNAEEQILKLYSDDTSVESYDDRWEIVTDNRVTTGDTADNIGQSTLAEKKDAEVRTYIEIIDNNESSSGYDIESINPGDTCKLLGFNDITSQTFSGDLTIKTIKYYLDRAVLELENLQTNSAKKIVENDSRISEQEASGRPKNYDTTTENYSRVSTARKYNADAAQSTYNLIQRGWGYIQGNNSAQDYSTTVTMPLAFDNTNYTVVVTSGGLKTTAPSGPADVTRTAADIFATSRVLTTQTFTVTLRSDIGKWTDYRLFQWIAIGKKV